MKNVLWVAIGGALGSVLRYLISRYATTFTSGYFPVSTLVVNLLGCLAVGILIGLFDRFICLSAEWRLLLITGFCGGFTTFSTFSAEAFTLLRGGAWLSFTTYILLSVFVGLAATGAGWWVVTLNHK